MSKPTEGPYYDCPGRNAITCETPQDVDHAHFSGFNVLEYDGNYLIAESIPHGPTRRLLAKSWEMRQMLTRLTMWQDPVEIDAPQLGGLLKAMYEARALLREIDGDSE